MTKVLDYIRLMRLAKLEKTKNSIIHDKDLKQMIDKKYVDGGKKRGGCQPQI